MTVPCATPLTAAAPTPPPKRHEGSSMDRALRSPGMGALLSNDDSVEDGGGSEEDEGDGDELAGEGTEDEGA